MRGVRHSKDGWDGQCDKCRQWWPLDTEFWVPRFGMRRCRACHNEERKVYLRKLRADNPEMRAIHRERSRENQRMKRRVWGRDAFLEYQRRWYAENHERLNAERAERHLILAELDGRTIRTSSREETPETLRIRKEYRKRWIEEHGPIHTPPSDKLRAYKRDWMRRKRAEAA